MKIQTPPPASPLDGRGVQSEIPSLNGRGASALRQALTPTDFPKRPNDQSPNQLRGLPSNFAYTTMQRIRREQREAERRQSIVAIACVVVVSLLGLGTLGYFFGKAMLHSLIAAFSLPCDLSLVPPTLFCLVFFALLNSWLLRHYSPNADK